MRLRVITALIGIPIVLAVLNATSPLPLLALAGFLAVIGQREYYGITSCPDWLVGILVVLFLAPLVYLNLEVRLAGAFFLLGVVGLVLASPERRSVASLGIYWLVAPLVALIILHEHSPGRPTGLFAANWVMMAVVPLWAGDTAAIFAGRAFGKTPLAQKLSPKKTVEGAVANLIACIAASFALMPLFAITWWQAGACGLVTGILGQAGDLAESGLKRRFDVKDSGTILPGHGGVLDRIDSILFTAVPVALILLSSGTGS